MEYTSRARPFSKAERYKAQSARFHSWQVANLSKRPQKLSMKSRFTSKYGIFGVLTLPRPNDCGPKLSVLTPFISAICAASSCICITSAASSPASLWDTPIWTWDGGNRYPFLRACVCLSNFSNSLLCFSRSSSWRCSEACLDRLNSCSKASLVFSSPYCFCFASSSV